MISQRHDALSAAGGRPVSYSQTSLDELEMRSTDLAAMYRFLEDIGYQVDISGLRGRFPEVPWTTFADCETSANRRATRTLATSGTRVLTFASGRATGDSRL